MLWSERDDAYLASAYPATATDEICQVLGRSMTAVHRRAALLGLRKSPEYIKAVKSRAGKAGIAGQFRAEHGHANPTDPTYICWWGMRQRCEYPQHKSYARYGGRGIAVCNEWHDFANFLRDMGERPKGMTLGRIDNDGPYSPANCRWETMKEQQSNRSSNRWITVHGETRTLSQWAELAGIGRDTLDKRLAAGWGAAVAVATPTRGRAKRAREEARGEG
jgi:hypothetical protein